MHDDCHDKARKRRGKVERVIHEHVQYESLRKTEMLPKDCDLVRRGELGGLFQWLYRGGISRAFNEARSAELQRRRLGDRIC